MIKLIKRLIYGPPPEPETKQCPPHQYVVGKRYDVEMFGKPKAFLWCKRCGFNRMGTEASHGR